MLRFMQNSRLRLQSRRTFATGPDPVARRSFASIGLRYLVTPLFLFYAGGVLVSRTNDNVYDFFNESVPGGEQLLDYFDASTNVAKNQKMQKFAQKEQEDSQVEKVLRNVRAGRAEGEQGAVKQAKEKVTGLMDQAQTSGAQTKDAIIDQAVKLANDTKSQAAKVKTEASDKVQGLTGATTTEAGRLETSLSKEANSVSRDLKSDLAKARAEAYEKVHNLSDKAKTMTGQAEYKVHEAGKSAGATSKSFFNSVKGAISSRTDNATRQISEMDSDRQRGAPASASSQAASTRNTSPQRSLLDASRPRDVQPLDTAVSVRGKELAPGVRIGLEMPPPPPPKPLPLVSPTVKQLGIDEPVIEQLAGTIDQFIKFLKDNPSSSNAKSVIEHAQSDLKSLADRMQAVKADEKARLEEIFAQRTKEVEKELSAKEVELQNNLKHREDEWRSTFEKERGQLTELYRKRLTEELETQNKIINERLREEVISQGIEMQRRWLRDVKIRVEEERGGRLSRLNELAGELKRLERLTLDNDSFLDANVKVHSLWSALRSVQAALERPHKVPFDDELTALTKTIPKDTLSQAALSAAHDLAHEGVDSYPDLVDRFAKVSMAIKKVSLLPENASVLAHFFSMMLSPLLFTRKGLVQGDDIPSILSRVQYHLNEGDLDSATRELNQVKGWAKILASDWLKEARRYLTVRQAIEVVETQATLETLLIV